MRLGNRIRRRIAFISRAWLKPVPGVVSGVAQNKYRLASHCFQLLNAVPESLWWLFGAGYLGYTGARSFDKWRGVPR